MDFPAFDGPRTVYAIAAVPRSGTTLLCKALRSTGVAGAPLEYFNERLMTDYFRRWGPLTVKQLRDRLLQARTSPNGYFGFSVQWDQFMRHFARNNCPDFRHMLVPSKVIFVNRVDKVRQAVSWARAAQTDQWASDMVAVREPRYSSRLIFECIGKLVQIEQLWRQYFRVKRMTPLEVNYEMLVKDFDGTFRSVTNFLGVKIDSVPEPPIERLYDKISEEWVQRFIAMASKSQVPSSTEDHADLASSAHNTSIESQS